MFIEVAVPLVLCVVFDIFGKPFAELVMRVKECRHDEMEQSPKFCGRVLSRRLGSWEVKSLTVHRILDRSTCEEKAVTAVEAEESLPSCTLGALDSLGLVKNHVLPFHTLKV